MYVSLLKDCFRFQITTQFHMFENLACDAPDTQTHFLQAMQMMQLRHFLRNICGTIHVTSYSRKVQDLLI